MGALILSHLYDVMDIYRTVGLTNWRDGVVLTLPVRDSIFHLCYGRARSLCDSAVKFFFSFS